MSNLEKETSKTFTPMPVKGYTPVSNEKLDLVNQFKELEEITLRLIEKAKTLENTNEIFLSTGSIDIQKAFMSVNRGVFNPSRVILSEKYQLLI